VAEAGSEPASALPSAADDSSPLSSVDAACSFSFSLTAAVPPKELPPPNEKPAVDAPALDEPNPLNTDGLASAVDELAGAPKEKPDEPLVLVGLAPNPPNVDPNGLELAPEDSVDDGGMPNRLEGAADFSSSFAEDVFFGVSPPPNMLGGWDEGLREKGREDEALLLAGAGGAPKEKLEVEEVLLESLEGAPKVNPTEVGALVDEVISFDAAPKTNPPDAGVEELLGVELGNGLKTKPPGDEEEVSVDFVVAPLNVKPSLGGVGMLGAAGLNVNPPAGGFDFGSVDGGVDPKIDELPVGGKSALDDVELAVFVES